jgi:hypothetical protein
VDSSYRFLQAFEDMQEQGSRLDAVALNIVVGTLMQSGIKAVSRRAVNVFHVAILHGFLR